MEFRRFFKSEDYAGEGLIEFLRGDDARAGGWVIEVDFAAAEAFENDEVIEVPEENGRSGNLAEIGGLFFEAFACKPVFAPSF